MRFHIHDTNRSIIAITPYNTSKSFRTFVDLCGSDLSISAPIKRFNDCHSTIPVKHVVVCVSANSYFIEMSKMNADEKDFHRMNYILKHIANFEFSETLTIHVPPLYYDSYINGLKLVTESYNNVKYKLQSWQLLEFDKKFLNKPYNKKTLKEYCVNNLMMDSSIFKNIQSINKTLNDAGYEINKKTKVIELKKQQGD